jgi:enamine deaminase RidA (YjgF/YER057c/UK114 family)
MSIPTTAPTTTQELLTRVDTRQIVTQVAHSIFGEAPGKLVFDGARQVGVIHESPEATYCFLEEIVPPDREATRARQTLAVFESIERVLQAKGMGFENVVRTWFYLDRILDWYDEFNHARTPFLESRGALEGLVPASTGIGIANRFGTALVAGAMAVKPKSGKANIQEVASPLQCSALAYKSTFSRAVEIGRNGQRELFISGTASIEPGGKTAHTGNPRLQIELTMQVVAAILRSRQMDWDDCTRAIAYLKDPADLSHFEAYLSQHGLGGMPLMLMNAEVCRDDLLFELEVDAIVGSQGRALSTPIRLRRRGALCINPRLSPPRDHEGYEGRRS